MIARVDPFFKKNPRYYPKESQREEKFAFSPSFQYHTGWR
jgi:hypothetical protein